MTLKRSHPCDRLGRIEPVDLSPEVRLASLAVLERLEAAGFPVGPCVAASAAAAAIDALHRSGAGPAFAASLLARAESRRRRRLIPQQFDGRNHAELARRYGVSIKTVRRIVDGARRSSKTSTARIRRSRPGRARRPADRTAAGARQKTARGASAKSDASGGK